MGGKRTLCTEYEADAHDLADQDLEVSVRVELHVVSDDSGQHRYVAGLYAHDGSLLGRGHGSTEEQARIGATEDWARREAVLDDAEHTALFGLPRKARKTHLRSI